MQGFLGDLVSDQSWLQRVLFEHGCSSSAFMLMHAHSVGTSAGVLLFDAVLSARSSWSGAYSQCSTVTTVCLQAIVLARDQISSANKVGCSEFSSSMAVHLV